KRAAFSPLLGLPPSVARHFGVFFFFSGLRSVLLRPCPPTSRILTMNAASTDSSEPGPGELVPAAPSVELEKTSSGAQIPAPAERTDGGRSTAPRSRSVLRKSRTDNFLERGALLLRAFACLFSLIALAVLASNKHGDWQDFDRYQEYR
ncbi:hypothetical protein BHE74_00038873, partial [Ensete ventricosum]